jgi:exosome complex component RRP43
MSLISQSHFKKYLSHEFQSQHFGNNTRADGRAMAESRKIHTVINPLLQNSSMVRIGNSSVICGIKCELALPSPTAPHDGYMCVNFDCSPLCSSIFNRGPPNEYVQSTSDILNQTFNNIDLKQLCIESGSKVWCVYVDVICLNYDGSLLDASVLAIRIALQNLIFPSLPEHQTSKFNLGISPICTTIGIFDDMLIMDPTADEEAVLHGYVNVILDESGYILFLKKTGKSMDSKMVFECIDLANDRLLK